MADGQRQDRAAWTDSEPQRGADAICRISRRRPTHGLRAVNVAVIEDGHGLVPRGGGWALDVSMVELERPLERIGHEMHEMHEMRVVLETAANLDDPVLQGDAIGADDGTTITEVASEGPRPS